MSLSDRTRQVKAVFSPLHNGLRQRQLTLPLGCFLAGLLFLSPALGQIAETAYVSPDKAANEYLDAIDRIEAEYGPYATELSDLYLGLGQTLMNKGEWEQARDAYHRGVLVVRVNSGPNSPEQTNHLYLIANIETMLGETKAADKALQNIYFVNSSHYGEDSPELLPVLERMYDWYSMTRPPGSPVTDFDDYEKYNQLTREMARVSEASKGKHHPDTALAYRRMGESQFQTAYHLQGLDPNLYSLVQVSAGEYYDAGRRAFRRYLESLLTNEDTTALEFAQALADLGDWYLLFERPSHSRDLYKEGYRILAESETYAKHIDTYMSDPKPVYFEFNPQPIFLKEVPTELQDKELKISMTVTNSGELRTIEVLNAPESMTEDDVKSIKRQLRGTRFRPAMKEGKVVNTEEFIWQYAIVSPGRPS